MDYSLRASLLVLNWKRPDNITRILEVQKDYESIAEILVFNNNKLIEFKFTHDKVKVLNASHDFGLRTRWILAALAVNECLIFQDDDILLSESVITRFIQEVAENPCRAYSLHGRNPDRRNQYTFRDAVDEAEIILTRAAAIHKSVVPLILYYENLFKNSGFQIPSHNGEDIFLSYCLLGHFGIRHKVIDLPYHNLPSPFAISSRPGHYRVRTSILQICRSFFVTNKPFVPVNLSELPK